jgi:hypothetical protein
MDARQKQRAVIKFLLLEGYGGDYGRAGLGILVNIIDVMI